MDAFYTISQMAAATGLSEHTLRYYERIGLVRSVARAAGGQRQYSGPDLAWVEFLLRLRATGMPIRSMQQFAVLRHEGDRTAGERRALLEEHLGTVRQKLEELADCEQMLAAKIALYREMESAMTSPVNEKRKRHERALSKRAGQAE
jgi:DNA-binding transcriptional MerR regulator